MCLRILAWLLVGQAALNSSSASPAFQRTSVESGVQGTSELATSTPLTARCEGLAEMVAEIARARELPEDRQVLRNASKLVERHAALHGWVGSISDPDLVPVERAARCDANLLGELPKTFEGDPDLLRLQAELGLAKALERNGRSSAAIEATTALLTWATSSDEGTWHRGNLGRSLVERELADLHASARQWQLALAHYGAWSSVLSHGSQGAQGFAQVKDHLKCRCLLEIGSYNTVISIANEHLQNGAVWIENWNRFHVSFADELALAQLLSDHRDEAEATLATARAESKGRYTLDLATLERAWKALHSDLENLDESDVRALASSSVAGCSEVATRWLIRRGPTSIEALLRGFSPTDESIASRQLSYVLMDTGDPLVRAAYVTAYDATSDEKVRSRLDTVFSRWHAVAKVRSVLEQR